MATRGCWEPYFLPWFAARGWPAHALIAAGARHERRRRHAVHRGPRRLCRGRRASRRGPAGGACARRPFDGGRGHRAHDGEPARASRGAGRPGAADRVVARRHASRHDTSRLYVAHDRMDPTKLSRDILKRSGRSIQPRRRSCDSQGSDVASEQRIAARAVRTCRCACIGAEPQARRPSSCSAPRATAIANPADVRATARHHGVEPVLVPASGHMLMLEPQWEDAAQAIAAWMDDELEIK